MQQHEHYVVSCRIIIKWIFDGDGDATKNDDYQHEVVKVSQIHYPVAQASKSVNETQNKQKNEWKLIFKNVIGSQPLKQSLFKAQHLIKKIPGPVHIIHSLLCLVTSRTSTRRDEPLNDCVERLAHTLTQKSRNTLLQNNLRTGPVMFSCNEKYDFNHNQPHLFSGLNMNMVLVLIMGFVLRDGRRRFPNRPVFSTLMKFLRVIGRSSSSERRAKNSLH